MPAPLPPPSDPHDLASELLLGMRLVGVQYKRIEAVAPFGFGFGKAPGRAQFHHAQLHPDGSAGRGPFR